MLVRQYALRLLLGATLVCAASSAARTQSVDASAAFDPGLAREFLDGMTSYEARDYSHAELMFRRILDRDPKLLRVRLELARTLYMEKKDEEADYNFRLASAERPSAQVIRNIVRFREAIRARRAWRFNFEVGFAPDSNINAATDKETVDIYGLPFRLDPDSRAHSGSGRFVGGDASVRLDRDGNHPIYVAAYGRSQRYRDRSFDDAYAGVEGGPEFPLRGGRLRTTAAGLMRWYGRRRLVTSVGVHFDYENLIEGKSILGGSLLLRHNDYGRRRDVDGWDAEARVSLNRPLGPSTLALAYMGIERNWATDPGQAFWRSKLGIGMLKEVGWGLRPQLAIDFAHQAGDAPLAPFAKARRDWLLQGTAIIYKRDWNVGGFAPSLSLTITRNWSTLSLYRERRARGEIRLARAF